MISMSRAVEMISRTNSIRTVTHHAGNHSSRASATTILACTRNRPPVFPEADVGTSAVPP